MVQEFGSVQNTFSNLVPFVWRYSSVVFSLPPSLKIQPVPLKSARHSRYRAPSSRTSRMFTPQTGIHRLCTGTVRARDFARDLGVTCNLALLQVSYSLGGQNLTRWSKSSFVVYSPARTSMTLFAHFHQHTPGVITRMAITIQSKEKRAF